MADDYDDPGFSGGNTDRPGLKRMLADIQRGLVDIVVVYRLAHHWQRLLDEQRVGSMATGGGI